ncbi:MAG: hypothetical protein IJW03_05305, partial [Clostridia bacterium]|nr:hypothetical protein [Clostridia bacterium]
MFNSINLELSLKPFKKTDSEYIRSVVSGIFEQWRPLLKSRKTISIMLWVGDGSELLDYAGELDDEFEWCRFIGTANLPLLTDGEPLETTPHKRKQHYIENAPKMTYRILKEIISVIKDEGARRFPEAQIRVGETFDIGPEFAISDFKYKRHREICLGASAVDGCGFVDSTAALRADTRRYAAYPDGIPEGTQFGTFLGKQSSIFLKDMGFDYLWLSNGLGFSADPWKKTGKIFDGEKYYPEKLSATKKKVFEFWKLFRDACPDIPLETRGTNNTVGIDYSSDGVPLHDIYGASLGITAPPNSPWAALNGNFGLEMAGHMSRCAELPSEKFPFRYYIHDPWWINSPWYDRYDGTPCDIYLPMAISRINADGNIETPNTLNILSIDNSFGDMPDACVNEPLPHLLKAEKNASDEIAPLVWVYPVREYTTSSSGKLLCEMNVGDNFICDAINDGLPLCCVSSTDNFLRHDASLYKGRVIISPAPESVEVEDKLCALARCGVGVIIYASAERLKEIREHENIVKVDTAGDVSAIRAALAKFGYSIDFTKKEGCEKPPTLAVSKYRGAYMFSVCNSNTTTDTRMHFPLGAPILIGCEAEMAEGHSSYRFSR